MKVLVIGEPTPKVRVSMLKIMEREKEVEFVSCKSLSDGVNENPDIELAIFSDGDIVHRGITITHCSDPILYRSRPKLKDPFIDLKKMPGKSGWRSHYKYHP